MVGAGVGMDGDITARDPITAQGVIMALIGGAEFITAPGVTNAANTTAGDASFIARDAVISDQSRVTRRLLHHNSITNNAAPKLMALSARLNIGQ